MYQVSLKLMFCFLQSSILMGLTIILRIFCSNLVIEALVSSTHKPLLYPEASGHITGSFHQLLHPPHLALHCLFDLCCHSQNLLSQMQTMSL